MNGGRLLDLEPKGEETENGEINDRQERKKVNINSEVVGCLEQCDDYIGLYIDYSVLGFISPACCVDPAKRTSCSGGVRLSQPKNMGMKPGSRTSTKAAGMYGTSLGSARTPKTDHRWDNDKRGVCTLVDVQARAKGPG